MCICIYIYTHISDLMYVCVYIYIYITPLSQYYKQALTTKP